MGVKIFDWGHRDLNPDLPMSVMGYLLGHCTAFHVRTQKVTGSNPDAAKFTKMVVILILGQCPGKFCFEGLHSAWDHMGIKKNLGALSQDWIQKLICRFLLMKMKTFLKIEAKLPKVGLSKITHLA